jgi:putative endonuclease
MARRSRDSEPDLSKRALGAYGEMLAARWYEARGYTVVARNWRCRDGEIDLIVRRGRSVVFCEVKTRSTDAFGAPVEAVGWRKQRKIRSLAAIWIDETGARPASIRFDVASVLRRQVEVFEAAF